MERMWKGYGKSLRLSIAEIPYESRALLVNARDQQRGGGGSGGESNNGVP